MNERRSEPPVIPMTVVFRRNADESMVNFSQCLEKFPCIAFDTEFPGVIHRTSINSSDDEFYSALKANVESTKVIQCGFTLFNAKGQIGGTWEINFSNFGDPSDTRNETSIEFLRRHGLDLNKIRNEGIDMFGYGFFPKLLNAFRSQKHVEFVTFQGAYDFAYFLSILNNGKLPETRGEFALEVVKVFGEVYDLKVMAGFCEGLGEHLGLSKLAQLLKIARVGRAHHAGSDSLMTALVFIKLKQVYEDSKFAKGMLYGIGKRNGVVNNTANELHSSGGVGLIPSLMCQQNVVSSYQSSNLMYQNGYFPSYDQVPVYYLSPSGLPTSLPWMHYNGMYVNHQVNHLPLSTFTYPTETPYAETPYAAAAGAGYNLGPIPNYYNNNNACFVVE
ncbi:hypothetical protein AALP_AA1G061800 [Arabis alpina]|uniref:poly(A)-specific ribonuclease n=1 Tax=Arabis alpina TaxID=50452 RepID=A0A087HLG0_ARAAL|nr:hypothetical protein AALP_AA1G061800 [Arabis alpina]